MLRKMIRNSQDPHQFEIRLPRPGARVIPPNASVADSYLEMGRFLLGKCKIALVLKGLKGDEKG